MKHDTAHQSEEELRLFDDSDIEIADDELGAPARLLTAEDRDRLQRPSVVTSGNDDDENGDSERQLPETKEEDSKRPIAWSELPQRRQLAIITLARLSEPLVQTSLQAYLFYQLRWFDPSLPDSTISSQAGILHASFMGAQCVTGMIWGRLADSRLAGRKTVLLVGLLGTSLSCIGFGFSTSFWQALIFRTLGGATNGNIGVMRTMISEIIREKKYQARAFILLPMTFNIGIIIGPILGGVLSDPAHSYPSLFKGVSFFEKFPYATPNIVSSLFLLCAAVAVWLGLEETLDSIRDSGRVDRGIQLGKKLASFLRSRSRHHDYSSVPSSDDPSSDVVEMPDTPTTAGPTPTTRKPGSGKRFTQRLAFRRIFTRNVYLTLCSQFLVTFHVGTFNSLWFVFLSTPVHDPERDHHTTQLPFRFTGGLGLQPRSVGIAMAILGVIGINMQLFLYPRISARLGTIRSWRYFLCAFPMVYTLVPFLSIVPSTSEPPHAKTGPGIWLAVCSVLLLHVLGRTFALPAQTILVNNCSPHPSVLGTVHGIGQSVSSGARTIGPMMGGFVFGIGLNAGYVGLAWWCLTIIGIACCLASLLVREGDGHEIWLEGDEEEE